LEANGLDVAEERRTTIRNGNLALHLELFDVGSKTNNDKVGIEGEGLQEVSGILKLSDVLPSTTETALQSSETLHITTPVQQWAYAAYIPLPFTSADRNKVWIRISAKVINGQVGFGILNGSEKAFYTRRTLGASPGYSSELLEVQHPEDARKLIIENDTPGGKRADLVISRISLLARPNSDIWKRLEEDRLAEVPRALKLTELLPTTVETSLERGQIVHITTPAGPWTYAAYESLPFAGEDRGKVWIRISVRVLRGRVGFGVLDGSEKAFYTRTTIGPTAGYRDVTLEVTHPEDSRKFIIENDTPDGQKAEVMISQISILARPGSKIWARLAEEPRGKEGPREKAK
jgi:hypothetical protein